MELLRLVITGKRDEKSSITLDPTVLRITDSSIGGTGATWSAIGVENVLVFNHKTSAVAMNKIHKDSPVLCIVPVIEGRLN